MQRRADRVFTACCRCAKYLKKVFFLLMARARTAARVESELAVIIPSGRPGLSFRLASWRLLRDFPRLPPLPRRPWSAGEPFFQALASSIIHCPQEPPNKASQQRERPGRPRRFELCTEYPHYRNLRCWPHAGLRVPTLVLLESLERDSIIIIILLLVDSSFFPVPI